MTERTRNETRGLLATMETLLALVKGPDEGVTVAALMEKIDEDIDVMRICASVLRGDGRIDVVRGDPPELTILKLTDCDANHELIRMLAALERKRIAQEKAKAGKARRRKAKTT